MGSSRQTIGQQLKASSDRSCKVGILRAPTSDHPKVPVKSAVTKELHMATRCSRSNGLLGVWRNAILVTLAATLKGASCDAGRLCRAPRQFRRGGMAEWSMAVVLKTTAPETVPGVRIPLPPPNL